MDVVVVIGGKVVVVVVLVEVGAIRAAFLAV
jgi:hypothetical protein